MKHFISQIALVIILFFTGSTLSAQVCPIQGNCLSQGKFQLVFEGNITIENVGALDFIFESGAEFQNLQPTSIYYDANSNITRFRYEFNCPNDDYAVFPGLDFILVNQGEQECHMDEGELIEYSENPGCAADFFCNDSGMYMCFDEAPLPEYVANVEFFFAPGLPMNGTYSPVENFLAGKCIMFSINPCYSNNYGDNNPTITLPDGEVCVYNPNGTPCNTCEAGGDSEVIDISCLSFLQNCNDELEQEVVEIASDYYCEQWIGDCGIDGNIYRRGEVGIGTEKVPPKYSLAVTGGILTEQIKVCLYQYESWCDYVFDDDYDLLSLCEVEDYILEYGHLHNTPSAEELEASGGFEVKEVCLDHQEKIEEIFLHLISIEETLNSINTISNKEKN